MLRLSRRFFSIVALGYTKKWEAWLIEEKGRERKVKLASWGGEKGNGLRAKRPAFKTKGWNSELLG